MKKIYSLLITSSLFWSTSYALTKDHLFKNCIGPQLEEVSTVPSSQISGQVGVTSWQLINDVYYVAVGGNLSGINSEDLRLYKFDTTYSTPELVEVYAVPSSEFSGIVLTINWQLINGTYYLAVGGALNDVGGEDLRLYKFDDTYTTPQLTEVYRVPISTLSGTTYSAQWQLINGIYYLAVGGTFSDGAGESLRLYKFDDTYATPQLIEVSVVSSSVIEFIYTLTWQLIDGTYYLAIGSTIPGDTDENLRLYKFDETYDTPVLTEVHKVSIPTLAGQVFALSWQLINGTYYLSVGGDFNNEPYGTISEDLRLYRFDDTYAIPQLIEVSKVPISTLSGAITSLDWLLINGTYYLAVGGILSDDNSEDLRLYQFDDDTYAIPQLIEVDTVPNAIISGIVYAVAWQVINNIPYLAVGGTLFGAGGNEDLRLYKFSDCFVYDVPVDQSISNFIAPGSFINFEIIAHVSSGTINVS